MARTTCSGQISGYKHAAREASTPTSPATSSTRTRKRTRRVTDESEDEDVHVLESAPSATGGLNWDLVSTLDQDPHNKPYFPPKYNLVFELNDVPEKMSPDPETDANCQLYTAWCLNRIRKMRVSNIVASMMDDPNLTIKWCLPLRSFYKDQRNHLRDLQLNATPVSNHEAVYGSMVGIVLPPNMACSYCAKNNGTFRCCIVVPGRLNGACTSCHYNSGGSKCSHRPTSSKRSRIGGVSTTTLGGRPTPSRSESVSDDSASSLIYRLDTVEQELEKLGNTIKRIKQDIKKGIVRVR
ncbi:hypothetical protein F5Y11DRAFT_337033 [Daldinia sp. FL1419]|nr:hypothetical protein F5Y11DRAFT_337033 [Daldinia sp. FL1419]